jgi:hypothetical protein
MRRTHHVRDEPHDRAALVDDDGVLEQTLRITKNAALTSALPGSARGFAI